MKEARENTVFKGRVKFLIIVYLLMAIVFFYFIRTKTSQESPLEGSMKMNNDTMLPVTIDTFAKLVDDYCKVKKCSSAIDTQHDRVELQISNLFPLDDFINENPDVKHIKYGLFRLVIDSTNKTIQARFPIEKHEVIVPTDILFKLIRTTRF